MRSPLTALVAFAATTAPSLASVLEYLPSAQDAFAQADALIHPLQPSSYLEVYHDYMDISTQTKRKLCVLHPVGGEKFDDDNFKMAVKECGNGGIVRLPDAN